MRDLFILGIETSCDDTSAAVLHNNLLLSNIISSQEVHQRFGGVVPELASRAHQQSIIPVVDQALKEAGIAPSDIGAIAFTRGPGLLGSLLVGVSFAKAFALARKIPMMDVDHMQAHVLAHFIQKPNIEYRPPSFPFLCLTVSGGHTQIVRVDDYFSMAVIGKTLDDAAGEAFDKAAKIMGLPYPGGPIIDRLAQQGNPWAFPFAKPSIPHLDFSFSGLKTSILYFIRDRLKEDVNFIEKNKNDLCASIQHTIIEILMEKLVMASRETGIKEIAIAGGVSANSGLRNAFLNTAADRGWKVYIPEFAFTTDNAAMIAITGYLKLQRGMIASQDMAPYARGNL